MIYLIDSEEMKKRGEEYKDNIRNIMNNTCRWITNRRVRQNYEFNPEENLLAAYNQSMECEIPLSLNEDEIESVVDTKDTHFCALDIVQLDSIINLLESDLQDLDIEIKSYESILSGLNYNRKKILWQIEAIVFKKQNKIHGKI